MAAAEAAAEAGVIAVCGLSADGVVPGDATDGRNALLFTVLGGENAGITCMGLGTAFGVAGVDSEKGSIVSVSSAGTEPAQAFLIHFTSYALAVGHWEEGPTGPRNGGRLPFQACSCETPSRHHPHFCSCMWSVACTGAFYHRASTPHRLRKISTCGHNI